jgi:hypothetical protein
MSPFERMEKMSMTWTAPARKSRMAVFTMTGQDAPVFQAGLNSMMRPSRAEGGELALDQAAAQALDE